MDQKKLITKDKEYALYFDEKDNVFYVTKGNKKIKINLRDLGEYLHDDYMNRHMYNVISVN